ncbi:MAG: DUF2892 domain-containing protein [Actinomycetes bacterium]
MEKREDVMKITSLMESTGGRALRALVGVVLIIIGFAVGGGWMALAIPGFGFMLVGIVDVCLLGPLFGQPLSGKAVRG